MHINYPDPDKANLIIAYVTLDGKVLNLLEQGYQS